MLDNIDRSKDIELSIKFYNNLPEDFAGFIKDDKYYYSEEFWERINTETIFEQNISSRYNNTIIDCRISQVEKPAEILLRHEDIKTNYNY